MIGEHSVIDRIMLEENVPPGLLWASTIDGKQNWSRNCVQGETDADFLGRVNDEAAALGIKRVEFTGIFEISSS